MLFLARNRPKAHCLNPEEIEVLKTFVAYITFKTACEVNGPDVEMYSIGGLIDQLQSELQMNLYFAKYPERSKEELLALLEKVCKLFTHNDGCVV